jgi:small subunit ribosomal protein S6
MAISIIKKDQLSGSNDGVSKFYEMILMFRSNAITHDMHSDLSSIMSMITVRFGGKVLNSEYWGLRPLAYEISGNKKSHYYYFTISINPDLLANLKSLILNNQNLIRHLFLSVDSDVSVSDLKSKSVMLKNLQRDMEKEMGEIVFNESNIFKI